MFWRKLVYQFAVWIAAVLSLSPHLLAVAGVGFIWAYTGALRWPCPGLPGLSIGEPVRNLWADCNLWQGHLVQNHIRRIHEGSTDSSIQLRDPETGEESVLSLTVRSQKTFSEFVVNDRLFLQSLKSVDYEVVDNVAQELTSAMTPPPFKLRRGQIFTRNGDLAYIDRTLQGFTLFAFQNGDWAAIGDVVLPDFDQSFCPRIESKPIQFSKPTAKTKWQIQQIGDELFVFLKQDGRLLFRKGLKLSTDDDAVETGNDATTGAAGAAIATVGHSDLEDSGSKPRSSFDDWSNWSLVRLTAATESRLEDTSFGLLIEGQPAALIIDGIDEGQPVAQLYRFNGADWNEVANQSLPLGSQRFHTLISNDGTHSYLAVTTTTQVCRLYAIEPGGLRQTKGLERVDEWYGFKAEMNSALFGVLFNAGIPVFMFAIGTLLAVLVGFFMWWGTKPDYEFGVHRVKLASIGWRGIAKLIDLGIIGVSTIVLAAVCLQGFDWLSFAEALNLHVSHSTTREALRVAVKLATWLLLLGSLFLIAQARWGITPGKWLCRIRTVRTSLRPIGFARSLARELVFLVDCGDFLCWTPGILSIALTNRRQRLGDWVADTIVIDSRSLCQHSASSDFPLTEKQTALA